MNDSFQPDTGNTSHEFSTRIALSPALDDTSSFSNSMETGIDMKSVFNKLIEEDCIKEAIYKDFSEIIRYLPSIEERNRLIIEYCKKHNHIQYRGVNSVLILEMKFESPSFWFNVDKKTHRISQQETLDVIHKICNEKLSEESTNDVSKKISELLGEMKGNHQSVFLQLEQKIQVFERKEQAYEKRKADFNFQDKKETITILGSDNYPLSFEGSKDEDMSNLDTAEQIIEEIILSRQEYQQAKQEFENFEAELASIKNNIKIVEELYGLALAGKLDKSSIISLNVVQLHNSTQQEGNSATHISVEKLLQGFNINSYHSFSVQDQNSIQDEAEAKGKYAISSTEIPYRQEEKIKNLLQKDEVQMQDMIRKDTIITDNEGFKILASIQDPNLNSYYYSQQNMIIEEKEAENNDSICFTDIPDRGEEQIEIKQQEITQLREKLIKRDATIAENEEFIEMMKQGRDINEIKEYLEETQVDVFYKSQKEGNTALCYSTKYPDIFKVLFEPLSHEKKLECLKNRNNKGETILHFAAMGKDIVIWELLISFFPNVNPTEYILEKDDIWNYVFHSATESGSLEVCKYILELLSDDKKVQFIFEKNKFGYNPLTLAIKCKNVDKYHYYLKQAISLRKQLIMHQRDRFGQTLLHNMASFKETTSYDWIISGLAENSKIRYILEKDEEKNTALHKAVQEENFLMCKYLVNSLPETKKIQYILEKNKWDHTALSIALEHKKVEIGFFLFEQLPVERRQNLIQSKNTLKKTFLHSISHITETSILELVLASLPEDIRVSYLLEKDYEHNTVLHSAAVHNNTNMCKYLVNCLPETKRSEYIVQENQDGYSALTYAFNNRLTNIMQHLNEEMQEPIPLLIPIFIETNIFQNRFHHITVSGDFDIPRYLQKLLPKTFLDLICNQNKEEIVIAISAIDDFSEDAFSCLFNYLSLERKKKWSAEINMSKSIALHHAISIKNEWISKCLTELTQKKEDNSEDIYVPSIKKEYKRFLKKLKHQSSNSNSIENHEKNLTLSKVVLAGNLDICRYLVSFLPETQKIQIVLQERKTGESETKSLFAPENKNDSINGLLNVEKEDSVSEDILEDIRIGESRGTGQMEERKESDLTNIFHDNFSYIDMESKDEETATFDAFGANDTLKKLEEKKERIERKLKIQTIKLKPTGDNYAKFFQIASSGNISMLKSFLVEYDVDHFKKDSKGQTALQCAILEKNNIEFCKVLINSIAEDKRIQYILEKNNSNTNVWKKVIEVKDKEKCEVLVNSLPQDKRSKFIFEQTDLVQLSEQTVSYKESLFEFLFNALSEESKTEFIFKEDLYGNTALHKIREGKDIEKSTLFIQSLPQGERAEFILHKNSKGQTVLHTAAYKKSLYELLFNSIAEESKIEFILERDFDGNTPLHKAWYEFEKAKFLINSLPQDKRTEYIMHKNNQGQTVLYTECELSVFELLFNALSEENRILFILETDNNGNTVLHEATHNIKKVKFLINSLPQDKRRDLILAKNNHGQTFLHTSQSQKDCFELLFNALSDESRIPFILETDNNGNTALHEATHEFEKAKFLINSLPQDKKNEYIMHKNNQGQTVLHTACKRSVFALLFNALSEENRILFILEQDNSGNNALHQAASRNEFEKIEFLINSLPQDKRTEYIMHKNNQGQTVLDTSQSNQPLFELLFSSLSEESKISFILA